MRRCGQELLALAQISAHGRREPSVDGAFQDCDEITPWTLPIGPTTSPTEMPSSLPSKVPTDVPTKTSLNIDDISNTLVLFFSQIIIAHDAH